MYGYRNIENTSKSFRSMIIDVPYISQMFRFFYMSMIVTSKDHPVAPKRPTTDHRPPWLSSHFKPRSNGALHVPQIPGNAGFLAKDRKNFMGVMKVMEKIVVFDIVSPWKTIKWRCHRGTWITTCTPPTNEYSSTS